MTSHEVLETKEARSTSRQDLVADILAADHLKLLGALDLMRTIPGGGVEGFELNSPDLKRNLEQLSEQTLGQLHGFLHDGSQPLTTPSSPYPVPGPSNVADNASPTPSASPLPTPTFPPAMPYHHHPMYAYPQHVYQPYSNPYAFANYVPAPIQSNYERNGELIAKPRTKRQYRKKSPPASCVGCDATDTPEWRRGPTGPRTLCNACGLTSQKLFSVRPSNQAEADEQLATLRAARTNRVKAASSARKPYTPKASKSAPSPSPAPSLPALSTAPVSNHAFAPGVQWPPAPYSGPMGAAAFPAWSPPPNAQGGPQHHHHHQQQQGYPVYPSWGGGWPSAAYGAYPYGFAQPPPPPTTEANGSPDLSASPRVEQASPESTSAKSVLA